MLVPYVASFVLKARCCTLSSSSCNEGGTGSSSSSDAFVVPVNDRVVSISTPPDSFFAPHTTQ